MEINTPQHSNHTFARMENGNKSIENDTLCIVTLHIRSVRFEQSALNL